MTIEALDVAKKGMRLIRNEALAKTDWAALVDAPLTTADADSYKAYRQYLRDLPGTMTDEDFMTFAGVPSYDDWKASQAA